MCSSKVDQSSETNPLPNYWFLTSDTSFNDYWVCFSDAGETLLFSRNLVTNSWTDNWDLFVVSIDGGTPSRFADHPLSVAATRASWSSRKRLVAFTGVKANGEASVWLINADGTGSRQLTITGLSKAVYYPSWYPDGNHLAVVNFDDGRGVIKRINLLSRTVESLTDSKEVLAGMPSVSPDGKSIAFAGQRNTGAYDQTQNRIWLIDETGTLRMVDPEQGRTPSWSPDGEWIAFESDRGSKDGYAVFVIHRTGGSVRRLTPYELNANHPVWSPDGKRLAFSARYPGGNRAWGIAVIEVPEL